jgi:hypothetical protein
MVSMQKRDRNCDPFLLRDKLNQINGFKNIICGIKYLADHPHNSQRHNGLQKAILE